MLAMILDNRGCDNVVADDKGLLVVKNIGRPHLHHKHEGLQNFGGGRVNIADVDRGRVDDIIIGDK